MLGRQDNGRLILLDWVDFHDKGIALWTTLSEWLQDYKLQSGVTKKINSKR